MSRSVASPSRLPRLVGEEGRAAPLAEPIAAALQARDWSAGRSGEAQLFLVLSRGGVLVGPAGRTELPAPALTWLPGDGRARTMRLDAGASGYRLAVAADVLAAAIGGIPGGGRLRRRLAGPAIVLALRLAPYAAEVALSLRVLAREAAEPGEEATGMVAAHLALVCLHVGRLAEGDGPERAEPPERAGSVAQRFGRLVALHGRDGWSVARYAEALGVTADRLHAASLRGHGKPPGAVIRERLVAAVRAELERTERPAEQIAFALGFRDPGYFSRFCRKHLGVPPGRYRRAARASGERPAPGSFAAWP